MSQMLRTHGDPDRSPAYGNDGDKGIGYLNPGTPYLFIETKAFLFYGIRKKSEVEIIGIVSPECGINGIKRVDNGLVTI